MQQIHHLKTQILPLIEDISNLELPQFYNENLVAHSFMVPVWIIILFGLVHLSRAFQVSLFASVGCYSHDMMMHEVGHEFNGHNVTWVQNRVYKFETIMKLPAQWEKVVKDYTNEHGEFLNLLVGEVHFTGSDG